MTFTEYKTVEKEILDCLRTPELGWRYETGDDVTIKYRGGDEQEMLLIPILNQKLKELNRGVITDDDRANIIIQRLRALHDNQEWIKWLRSEKTYKFSQDEPSRNIILSITITLVITTFWQRIRFGFKVLNTDVQIFFCTSMVSLS